MRGEFSGQDGRRTDTRDRIRTVALEVFSERGWEGATLREIAERVGITRPALYYHFDSKEAVLDSIHGELARSVDDIIAWAKDRPRIAQTRAEVLDQLSSVMTQSWGAFIRFAQREESAMRSLKGAASFIERIDALAALLVPADTIDGRIKARLALDALFMADARSAHLGGEPAERRAAALAIAKQLTQ
jgi:AcrR family transcriptional regulator